MIKGLSLFANVGIGELLIKDAGVDIVVANELLPERAKFYREVHPDSTMIQGDITDPKVFSEIIEKSKKEQIKFLIATPPCFAPGVLVNTLRGMIPIEQIKIGDKVLTHKNRYCAVAQIMSRPFEGMIQEINISGIPLIKATEEHPFFVVEKKGEKYSKPFWVHAKDLTINHYIAVPTNFEKDTELSENFSDNTQWKNISLNTINFYQGNVYNLEVEEDNSYTVFNLATHNCQGMSMAGKMDPDDIRNTLILKVIEAIKKLDPDYAIVENVVQMLKTGIIFEGEPIKILDLIHQELGNKYNIKAQVMDAADFETPQYRKRAIILLSKKEFKEWTLPKKHPHITVREVIGDLPSLEAGQKSDIPLHEGKKHNDNHILWMKHTPTGETAHHNEVHYPQKDGRPIKGFMSTYKRMGWDRPAPTVTMANGSISSQNNVHPGTLQNDGTYSDARVLSILEIMKISGIPTNWAIPSWASENLIRHVVGEMVPPKLIYHIVKNMPKAKK